MAYSANFMKGMFSNMGMGGGFNFADYASIRNGSYHKLLNSYYAAEKGASSGKGSSSSGTMESAASTRASERTYNYWTKDGMVQRKYDNSLATSIPKKPAASSTATSKEDVSTLASIESNAEKLSDAADALLAQGSKSLFRQVEKTDAAGKKTTGYDTDAIYKAVASYAENYNRVAAGAGSSNIMAIRSAAASMNDFTKVNEKKLSEIGISWNEKDRTISVDEKAFKNADMDKAKALFQGTGSYGYQVSAKASVIDYHAQYEASKASTYNSSGIYAYNYSAGSLWNSMM